MKAWIDLQMKFCQAYLECWIYASQHHHADLFWIANVQWLQRTKNEAADIIKSIFKLFFEFAHNMVLKFLNSLVFLKTNIRTKCKELDGLLDVCIFTNVCIYLDSTYICKYNSNKFNRLSEGFILANAELSFFPYYFIEHVMSLHLVCSFM